MFCEIPERPAKSIPYCGGLKNHRELGGVSTGSYCSKIAKSSAPLLVKISKQQRGRLAEHILQVPVQGQIFRSYSAVHKLLLAATMAIRRSYIGLCEVKSAPHAAIARYLSISLQTVLVSCA